MSLTSLLASEEFSHYLSGFLLSSCSPHCSCLFLLVSYLPPVTSAPECPRRRGSEPKWTSLVILTRIQQPSHSPDVRISQAHGKEYASVLLKISQSTLSWGCLTWWLHLKFQHLLTLLYYISPFPALLFLLSTYHYPIYQWYTYLSFLWLVLLCYTRSSDKAGISFVCFIHFCISRI